MAEVKDTVVGTAIATISRKGTVLEEQTEEEVVEIDPMPTGPRGSVGVTVGRTINLNDYNSLRIDVSLTVPVPAGQLNERYGKAVGWVLAKLAKLEEQARPQTPPPASRGRR